MRRILDASMVVAMCIGSATLASSAGAASHTVSTHTPLGFEWNVEHGSDAARTVRCNVIVRNLSDDSVLAQPTLRAGWGQQAEVAECTRHWCLEASVLVSESGTSAQFEARIRVEGKVVAANKATVSLGEHGEAPASNDALSPAHSVVTALAGQAPRLSARGLPRSLGCQEVSGLRELALGE